MTLAPGLTGCTLWGVFSPELLAQGPPSGERIEENATVTGEERIRIVSATMAPMFSALTVCGQIEVQAKLDPWVMYQGVQSYRRSVESIFTRGRIERVIHFTDPPGHGGTSAQSAEELEDLDFRFGRRMPRRTRGAFWAAAPDQPTPRAAVSWRLYDTVESQGQVTVGDTLGVGVTLSTNVMRRIPPRSLPGRGPESRPSRNRASDSAGIITCLSFLTRSGW